MAATIIDAVTNTVVAGTSYTLTPVAPIVDGDLLLIIHCQDNATAPTSIAGTAGAFATAIVDTLKFQGTTLQTYGAGAPTGGNSVWWRVASGETGAYTVTAGSNRNMGGTLLVIRGANFQTGPGGAVNGRFVFDASRTQSRSTSTITHQNGPLNVMDCSYDNYLAVCAWCQNVTGVTANLSGGTASGGWTLTNQGSIALSGVSQRVSTAPVNLHTNPDIGTFSCDTDQSTGTGRGYVFLIGDQTSGHNMTLQEVGGDSGSLTAPSIEDASPADDAELSSDTATVSFTVANPDGCPFALLIKFVSDPRTFLIYDYERGFAHPFTSSTVDDSDLTAMVFTLRQLGGWQDDIEEIYISGVP